MLRNLSKYCLFICCKQSSSTHFCHFLTTAFVTDVLAGSNPMRWAQKRKASNTGGLTIQWWAMRDVRVRLAPPASASSLRSSRAALENASRFLSFAPCRVRIPLRWVQKRKAPIAGSLSNQWWAMRDVRVRLRRPHPLRRFAPRVLRWKTLRVSSAPHPCGFESHEMGPNKNGPLSRTVSNSMVGDEGFEPPALCV